MKTLKEIIEQFEFCNYKDEHGHNLKDNMAFIALKEIADRTLIPKFKVGETVFFMKNNIPVQAEISCSEVFNVNSNQARVKYNAKDFINPVTWLDHTDLPEYSLYLSKEELLNSL